MKLKEKYRKTIFYAALAVFVVSLGVLLYEGYESIKVRKSMNSLKELLLEETSASSVTESTAYDEQESTAASENKPPAADSTTAEAESMEPVTETTAEPETTTEPEPVILEKYSRLYEENNALAGWLKIDDTVIDYPVLWLEGDNDYYLSHDFYGNENRYGQIVLDYRCSIDPPTTNLILHGHHMKDGSMFGSLKKYKRKSYWKEHRYIHFDTIYEEGIYEIFAVFLSKVYYQDEDVFKYYNFVNAETEEEYNYFYENVKKLTNFSTGVVPKYGDSILTLSTCEYSQENGRLVVVARKLSADEIAALAETETEAGAGQKGARGLNDE